ncbi:MAG: flavodoxin domain-containing protein [Pseudomonadota bacterium]
MQVHFVYGTETSTAEFLCEDLSNALPDGCSGTVSSMETVDPTTLDSSTFYVLVSSTFGSGDVPGTAVDFYEKLQKQSPDLSHVRFAVFGLGDTTFGETYNQGSEKLMTQMLACKATMVGERGLFDSSSPDMPEDIAVPWLLGILETTDA